MRDISNTPEGVLRERATSSKDIVEEDHDESLEFEGSPCKQPLQLAGKPKATVDSQSQVTLADFRILEEVGSGSFGLVKLVEKDGFKYALKELSKNRVMELGKIESVFRERDFLKSVSHPAFPRIYQTF